MADNAAGFLSRWAKRKAQLRSGVPLPDAAQAGPTTVAPPPAAASAPVAADVTPAAAVAESTPARLAPTLADVAALEPGAEVSRFVGANVDPAVTNAAMKKLFADPHFNLMDGLDTYIDDYGKPDPIPAAMLRQMAQAQFLGLFSDEEQPAPLAPPLAAPTEPPPLPDENADLRLQPDDAAGRPGPEPGAGQDAGREL
jgi:hypothetical protein